MATAPQPQLPLFYQDLMPLNSRDHGDFKSRMSDSAPWLATQHAIPLTVEEFPQAQRHYPIIFSAGEDPVPLALMGLNEGVNVFVGEDGKLTDRVYLPAYVRRYPWILARLQPDSDVLSLCFDPTIDVVGEFDEGNPLFDGEETTDHTKSILEFCQRFEEAGQKTKLLVEELKKHDLLMDGEAAIAGQDQPDRPFIYRGFQMVNEEKLRDMRGDTLRSWNQNGMIAIIFAHLFSMDNMRDIFARQVEQGRAPQPQANIPDVPASSV